MKIENDYKVLTQEETIKRLKEMLQTQQPYGYNNDTIYNAIDYLNLLLMIIENEENNEETKEEESKENPYKDFCEFVAKMILSDDFEENAGANAEFLCRKLSKLGIVKADKDKWVLAESEDKE